MEGWVRKRREKERRKGRGGNEGEGKGTERNGEEGKGGGLPSVCQFQNPLRVVVRMDHSDNRQVHE